MLCDPGQLQSEPLPPQQAPPDPCLCRRHSNTPMQVLKKVGKTTRPFRYGLNEISYDYTVEVTNRFKGLDLIDLEELWSEVCDIAQEMVGWGGLTNSREKNRSKRQRRKGKIYLSKCRVPKKVRRDKKDFLSDQCKEIEENNRMGKTRDLFKKIRDAKGTFHAKMGSIKDRNCMHLTEAEGIKKWQGYTEELYKRDLHDPDNHDGVITHLEPEMLECKVK